MFSGQHDAIASRDFPVRYDRLPSGPRYDGMGDGSGIDQNQVRA
jgi:hypothetical protein